ncbi:MAG: transglutaminase-like domain-containing protein [Sulfolobales archaeon]
MSKALPCLIAVLLASLVVACFSEPAIECTIVYFLNSIVVEPSTSYSGVLYLESPVNISVLGLNQTTRAIVSKGVIHSGEWHFINVAPGSPLYAFVVFEVRVCSPEFSSSLNLVREVLAKPESFLKEEWEVDYLPTDALLEYVGTPPEVVKTKVVPDFEDWLKTFSWYYRLDNVSRYPLLVSVYAAWFIYRSGYIRYEASLLPRTVEEVVESKRGDCDDMSRVLVGLLWSYGIPAVIVHGFTVIEDFSMRSTLGALEYVFERGGPHAFVLAYIPNYGWLSLDFLAGSLLTNQVVIWRITKSITLSREEVEEVERIHSAVVGKQLMTVIPPQDSGIYDATSIELFINSTLGLTKPANQTFPPSAGETETHAAAETVVQDQEYIATSVLTVIAVLTISALAVLAWRVTAVLRTQSRWP